MKIETITRDSDGKLPAYAWFGKYPIFYLDKGGNVMCADCATQSLRYDDDMSACDGDVYWEGAPIHCEDCNCEIESVYGDPDEE